MNILGILISISSIAMVLADGSNCGATDYFGSASFTIKPTPAKGVTSVLTLTGVTPNYITLHEWDLYLNLNGGLVYQYDVPLSGSFGAKSAVKVTYNFTTPSNAQSGYYSMRLLLQTSQFYYINCWIYNYFISG